MAAYLQALRTDEADPVLATHHDGSTLAHRLTDKYGDRVCSAFTVFGREGSFVPLPDDLPAGRQMPEDIAIADGVPEKERGGEADGE